MATSLIINSTDTAGKAVAKSYTAINPDATDAELRDFATKINSLSDHTLDKIFRVDKKDITSPPADPNFTINPTTFKTGNIGSSGVTIALSYDGAKRTPTLTGKKPYASEIAITSDAITFSREEGKMILAGENTATITVTLPAIDGYTEATATLTITECDTLVDI